MKNKKSKVLKLYTKGLKQGMDESLIQALQDRIKELEQINEEHRKINGELRKENEKLHKQVREDQGEIVALKKLMREVNLEDIY